MRHHLWLYLSGGIGLVLLVVLLISSRVARVVLGETVSAPKARSEIDISSESPYRKAWRADSSDASVRRRSV